MAILHLYICSLEDEELVCDTGPGAYLSISATILFGVASLFMCCAPRVEPFCYNLGMEPARKRAPPPTREQTVIVQPVIIQTPVTDEEQPKKKKKKNKVKKTKLSEVA